MMIRSPLSLAVAALTLTLAGCTGSISPRSQTQTTTVPPSAFQQVEQLLSRAEQAPPIEAAKLKADAANRLIDMGRNQDAYRVLEQVNTQLLPPSIAFEIARLQAENALTKSNPAQALTYLSQTPITSLPTEQAIELSELKIQAYTQQQDPISEARELIHQSQLSEQQQQLNRDRIWNALTKVPTEQLSQLAEQDNSYQEQGWFELADSIYQSGDISQQHDALQRWGILWENHPAKQTPPTAIHSLSAPQNIQHLALLLPQTGKLQKPGKAITEGFLSAYYQSRRESRNTPKITLLDSNKIDSSAQLARILEEQSIDFVVGPLDKGKVNQLTSNLSHALPMLALNYSNSSLNSSSFQFGLSAEDEARQAAEKIWQDGNQSAAMLTASTSWGRRAADAFATAFEQLGGTVVSEANYQEETEYNNVASQLLATDKSTARSAAIKQLSKRKIHTQERRRQDIDAIFIAAQPSAARQLKPILAFHYATDLPIYATSHVYSGTPNPITDQDLSDIRFLGTPWNLDNNPRLKHNISSLRPDTNARFGQLYALGIDAYQLYPLLTQLSNQPNSNLQGVTGKLSIKQPGIVSRQLEWATFQEGLPLKLN